MSRRGRRDPAQPDLFGEPASPALPMSFGAASWVEMYWPQYAADVAHDPRAPSPHFLWAVGQDDLANGPHGLLLALANRCSADGLCCCSLPELARAAGVSRNTCRRYLQGLLSAGLVTIRPWTTRTKHDRMVLGYEFKLIVDVEDRAAALAEGFLACRPAPAKAGDAID